MSKRNIEPIAAPAHLSARTQALWSSVVPRRGRSPERLALVQMALEALDRADAAREAVDREGMSTVTATTKAVHVHPLVKVERENRALFAKLWTCLGFNWSVEVDGYKTWDKD